MHLRTTLSLLMASALALSGLVTVTAPAVADEPTPSVAAAPVPAAMPLSSNPKIKAWQDLRFGLFIHWGVYSEYGGYVGDKQQTIGYPEQIKAWESISDEDYLVTAAKMTIPDFDPAKWCQDAKDAGMKYLLVTSKHHDGFTMWKSDTTTFDFSDAAPGGRDPMKELADACKAIDMKLGFYFSIIDWTKQTPEPYRNVNPLDEEMMTLIRAQLKELLSGTYGEVPELWFDMGGPTPEQSERMANWVREFSPNTVVNSRVWNDKGDFEVGGDNALVTNMTLGPWESIRSTFPKCWGYCRWPDIEAVRTSPTGVQEQTEHEVENLFTTVANGGQYLLNIGPRGSGAFDPFEVKILEGISQWHNRHPQVIHGAVPTYYPAEQWGQAVVNGDAIYLGIRQWPEDGQIRLQGAGTNVVSVEVDDALAPGQSLDFRVDENNDLWITLPTAPTDPVLPVIKVITDGEPTYAPSTAVALEVGDMKPTQDDGLMRIASPKSRQGTARYVAHVRNDADTPVKMTASALGSIDPQTPLAVTVGQTTLMTTAAELSDGIRGFTVPAHSYARVIVERANKTYYADGLGGRAQGITALLFGVDDPSTPRITVRHTFTSTDGEELPAEITALTPADRSALGGVPQLLPSPVMNGVVSVGDYKWTFRGWDAPFKTPGEDSTVTFTGTWEKGNLTFLVSYENVSGSPDHEFPEALLYMTPARPKEYAKGETVTPTPPRTQVYRDRTSNKTWRWQRWEPEIVENISAPVTIKAVWEYQRDVDVTVREEYVAKDGSELPAEVLAQKSEPKSYPAPVDKVYPTFPTETTVPVEGGQWIFAGFDRQIERWPGTPEVVFTGTWVFQKTSYPVTITYMSATDGKELPEIVANTASSLVRATEGEDLTLKRPVPAAVAVEGGVWEFTDWEPQTVPKVSAPVDVVGRWVFHAGSVAYPEVTFESATPDVELPLTFIFHTPSGDPYVIGGKALPPTVEETVLETDSGLWRFVGWTPEEFNPAGEKIAFVGKWVKIPSEHTVTFTFEAATDLPQSVLDLLPEVARVGHGQKLTTPELAITSIDTVEGTWAFQGWDTDGIVEDDMTVTGLWTYIPRVYQTTVTVDGLPDMVASLHDTSAPVVFKDNTVCAPEPTGTSLDTPEGLWEFHGWVKDCYTMDEVAQLVSLIEGDVSGSPGGALFFSAEKLQIVYKLTFTPVWTFTAKHLLPGGITNTTPPDTPDTGDTPKPGDEPKPGDTPKPGDEPKPGDGHDPDDGKNPNTGDKPQSADKPQSGDQPKPDDQPDKGKKPKDGDSQAKGTSTTTTSTPGKKLAFTGAHDLMMLSIIGLAAAATGLMIQRRRR